MTEIVNYLESVKKFWNTDACSSYEIKEFSDKQDFYKKYREFRYRVIGYILFWAPFSETKGKSVLEIGCGNGADGVMFAMNGANYTGVDLTQTAVNATKEHFGLLGLQGNFKIDNAEQLSFADETFDYVYSFGVLHHTPSPQQALNEVYRVLRSNGKAIIMLYYRQSFNYFVRIMLYMRMKVFLKILSRVGNWNADSEKVAGEPMVGLRGNQNNLIWDIHYKNFLKVGWNYFKAKNFVNHCTDGPECPIAYVFSKEDIRKMFSGFKVIEMEVRHFPLRRYRLLQWLPLRIEKYLGSFLGWHLLVIATK